MRNQRWKTIRADYAKPNDPNVYLWDKTHTITIERDEFNNWFSAQLNDGPKRPLAEGQWWNIERVAKLLGVA